MTTGLAIAPNAEMRARYPFYYALVPKGFSENIAFRRKLLAWAAQSFENKQSLWIMCKRDPLFYINAFCYTHDPRLADEGKFPVIPFITYPQQDEVFDAIYHAIGVSDVVLEKSRDAGASWLCLVAFEHKWHFFHYLSFLLLSAKLELVDKPDAPKSLFYKIDLVLKHQPGWLVPSFNRIFTKLVNNDTNSVIDGEATTGDMGRGGRNTAVLMDEFASVMEDEKALSATRDNTKSRIMNSTPAPGRGKNCAFYRQTQKEGRSESNPNGPIKLRMHWTDHPVKAEGLYYDAEGKARSPWYDRECARADSPAEIACELDIDYAGASSQFFSQELINRLLSECTAPVAAGELLFDTDSLKNAAFVPNSDGDLKLWDEPPVKTEQNPEGIWSSEYSIGVDISHGTGATNSTISVTDKRTGRKIAQYANSRKKPYEWGRVAVAMCRWFNGAFLIWEGNGPGREFGDEVIKNGYRNFFYRKNERTLSKNSTEHCGWYATPETKQQLLGAYQKGLSEGIYKNLCAEALKECSRYIFLPTGGVEHSGTVRVTDGSAARINHGDMVIADALSYRGMTEIPYREKEEAEEFPYLSMGWRREQSVKERSRTESPFGVFAANG